MTENPIDERDIRRIQLSFARVILLRDRAAELFYFHLFREDPRLRAMFNTDLERQGAKLIGALGMLVFSMRDTDRVRAAIVPLARQHAGYGVRPEYFRVFGRALMLMLEELLKPEDFDDETRAAWKRSYDLFSRAVSQAVEEITREAPRGG